MGRLLMARLITAWLGVGGEIRARGRAAVAAATGLAVGAKAIGATAYPIPSNAIHVAVTGNDTTGTGTAAAPYLTVKAGVAAAGAGATVVVHAGVYHEGATYDGTGASLGDGVAILADDVTIQSAPGEAVWLDGSVVVTGWTLHTTGVYKANFVTRRDRGVTHTRGSNANTWAGDSTFVNSSYPLAAWPEMLFVDGTPYTQVDSIAAVTAGTFFVAGSYPYTSTEKNAWVSTTYYVGVSTTSGHEFRISDLQRAVQSTKNNTTIRGIGFRRYSPALCDSGAIYHQTGAGFTMENCIVRDISIVGLTHASGASPTIRRCSFIRCGNKGMGSYYGHGGVVELCVFDGNNHHRFNYGPDAGSLKIGKADGFTVRNCWFVQAYGHHIWPDEGVKNARIYNNRVEESLGMGIIVELSDSGWVFNNYVKNCGRNSDLVAPYNVPGVKLSGSNGCRIWNNTIDGSEVPLQISQDSRRIGAVPGVPSGQTWNITSVEVHNNVLGPVLGASDVQSSLFRFYDDSDSTVYGKKSTVQFGPDFGGNVYVRAAGVPLNSIAIGYTGCPVGPNTSTPILWNTIAAWRAGVSSATADTGSVLITTDPVAADGTTAPVAGNTPGTLPSDLAGLCAQSGAKVGAWPLAFYRED